MRPDAFLAGEAARATPHRAVFWAVTGDAACGLAGTEPASFDLRGAHVTPVRGLLSLRPPPETAAHSAHHDGRDAELLTQDVGRLALALLKKNGQVIEHIESPWIVATSPAHEELRPLARACACRHWAHHYLGHAGLLRRAAPTRLNAARAERVLRTGLHLLETGRVEVRLKALGMAAPDVPDAPATGHDYLRLDELVARLGEARNQGPLPAVVPDAARAALDDWLVRTRITLGSD